MSLKELEAYAVIISAILLGVLLGIITETNKLLALSDLTNLVTSVATVGLLVTAIVTAYSWKKSILYQRKLKALDDLSKAFSSLALSIGTTKLCLEGHGIFLCSTDPTKPYDQTSLSESVRKEVRDILIEQACKRDLYDTAYETFMAVWKVDREPGLLGSLMPLAEDKLSSLETKEWEKVYSEYRDLAHQIINSYYKKL